MNLSEAQKLDLDDAEIYFYPRFFEVNEADIWMESLQKNITWRYEKIRIFGKEIFQPRLTAWYGDTDKTYSYSGITMHPENWTKDLKLIKQKIENQSGVAFTNVLLNLYRTGQDSMGWHSDDEKELGQNPVIASVSLGAERVFQLRHKTDKKHKVSLKLSHGSLLLMKGQTQHFWQHQIPKTKRQVSPRINLTFRKIIG